MGEFDIREDLPCSPPRPNWRKRMVIGGLIAVPLCLAAPYLYFVLSSDQELQQAIAEADWLDPGWRIPELEQKRAVIRGGENSGLVLIAAKQLLPANWPYWDHLGATQNRERSEEDLRTLQEGLGNIEPPVQLDPRQTDALREELQRADKALLEARKVADLPRGRYPIAYARDFISTLLPHVQDARNMGNLLAYDVLLRAQDEDLDGALTSCRGIRNCGRSIGDEPTLISMLVRIALNNLAIKKLEWILAQGEASEAALAAMQQAFEEEAAEPLLLMGARGERGMLDGAMQAIQNGDLDPRMAAAMLSDGTARGGASVYLLRLPGLVKNLRAALLKQNNQLVEIAKLPVEQQVERMKEFQATIQELPERARPFILASSNVTAAFHRNQAELRCAVALLALERYRRANNRWPEALTDLVPAYLPKVPLDPFDGAPLRYRRWADGVVVYSIGPDGKDNGGNLHKDATKEGTDLGLRLWDVPKRRQTPKPPEPLSKNLDP